MALKRKRSLRLETLETRHLMAGWHNLSLPADVNGDGSVAPADALVVINTLAREGKTSIDLTGTSDGQGPFLDVDNNGRVTPGDALGVLNWLADAEDWLSPVTSTADLREPDADAATDVAAELAANVVASLGAEAEPPILPLMMSYDAVISDLDADPNGLLMQAEVATLLERASRASASTDAIIAVVDRSGRILGVRVEAGVSAAIQGDPDKLAFAIDGAVAKARTAAFFSNNAAPLTSRTIRFISQSTVTQREVESSPINADPRYVGPGFVAPIGVGGQFPPAVRNTPQVDLLGIERQSRDSQFHAGANGILGDADDFELNSRFNVDLNSVPLLAQDFFSVWPESYGVVTETSMDSRSRGIATLPGGVPLYKQVGPGVNLVGGIGVFFPGEDGFATHEQGFVHASDLGGKAQGELARTNADKVLEAEYIAFAAAAGGGILGRREFVRNIDDLNDKLPPLPNFVALNGRIDLVGITLEIYGPTPSRKHRVPGIDQMLSLGRKKIADVPVSSGSDVPVAPGGVLYLDGQAVPEQWLVAPKDSPIAGGLTAADVESMITEGIAKAEKTRAAIRLKPDFLPGAATQMVLAVSDTQGNVLGLYRMPDATVFSIDVAVAKSRNTAYYADAAALQPADRVDFNEDGSFSATPLRPGDTAPLGTAFTSRTFRFLAGPRYPTGKELPRKQIPLAPATPICDQSAALCRLIAPFSGLRMPGINPYTAENVVASDPLPDTVYADPNSPSALLYDAFVPSRNFRDPGDVEVTVFGEVASQPLANQNGVVFFPGSTPVYLGVGPGAVLAGGLGVSGDGVDQDDVVTASAQVGFAPPPKIRADQFFVGGVRLPFQKFNRVPSLK